MCGIAGIYGVPDRSVLSAMAERLRHRGPDDSGSFVERFDDAPGVGLAHRRLSIIDLSERGRQPLASEDGSIVVVCNGEIYNFRQLRTTLERRGHQFRSDSDSEVLVHLYEDRGVDMLGELNGIFAFALWDGRTRTLLLARDRFGVKPLYYCRARESVLFASEIKSLLVHPDVQRSVCPDALRYYLAVRYVPDPLTMFAGIHKIRPGHYCVVDETGVTDVCYWQIRYAPDQRRRPADVVDELRQHLATAVRRQLVADVPLGLSFSGGVDSGAVLAMMRAAGVRDIKAYTVGYPDREADLGGSKSDLAMARRLAHEYDLEWREILFDPATLTEVLPRVVWHMDEPLPDSGAVASFLVAERARAEVKVLLSGQGGDELFGGYPWHRAALLATWARRSRVGPMLLDLVGRPLAALPVALGGRPVTPLRRLKKFAAHAGKEFAPGHLGFISYVDEDELGGLLAPCDDGRGPDPLGLLTEHLVGPPELDPLHRTLNLDMHTFLPAHNLLYADKTGMAHGIEVRVPFLDNDLVDFVATIPASLKVTPIHQKLVLKRALEGLLPREAIYRRKTAFGGPLRFWLRHHLRDMVRDLLSEPRVRRLGYFDPATVRTLIDAHESGRRDTGPLLFSLLTFALWHQTFIE